MRPAIADRVVITGAQGFLGRHLVAEWLSSRPSARLLGLGRSRRRADVFTYRLGWAGRTVQAPVPPALRRLGADPRYEYRRVDVADEVALAPVFAEFRPEIVVHAASALRDSAWDDLARSNVGSVVGILRALASSGITPTLVVISSGSVYGSPGADALPLRESIPCEPLDLYAASKLAGEHVARILGREHGVPIVCARVFNPLGPGLQDRHFAANVAGRIVAIARGLEAGPLQVGRLDTTRDFVDVRDVSRGLVILSEHEPDAPTRVVNVASGRETPVRTVLAELLRLGGLDAEHVHADIASREIDVSRSVADVRVARSLGFEASIRLGDSLTSMLRYYEESMPDV